MHMLNTHFTSKDGATIKRYAVPDLGRDTDNDSDAGPEAFVHIIQEVNDDKKIPISMISGSLARYAAKNYEMKAFAYFTGLEKKPALAAQLANKIRDGAK